jgi:hypothetical protein
VIKSRAPQITGREVPFHAEIRQHEKMRIWRFFSGFDAALMAD